MGLNECSSALNSRGKPAVSLMSGGPTFDIEEKKPETGEFKTPPRPTGRRSNYYLIVLSTFTILIYINGLFYLKALQNRSPANFDHP